MSYENRITRAPFGTLLLLISFSVTSASFLSPALPAIATFFAISSNKAQEVMIYFLVGYGLGQLVYGPLVNRFGRKLTLFLGMNLAIFANIICSSAAHIHVFDLLLLGRVLVGLGAGASLEIAFTLAHDLYPPEERHKVLSYLVIGLAISPGISIALNGWLVTFFGWTSCFLFILIYTFFLVILSFFRLPDLKGVQDKTALQSKTIQKTYISALKQKSLWQGGLFLGLMSSIPYIFSAAGPFIGITELGLSESHYGTFVLSLTCASILGGMTSGQLSHHHSRRYFFGIALTILTAGTVCLFLGFKQHHFLVPILFGSMMLMYFACYFILPTASSLVMSDTPDIAHGTALMNFIRIFIALMALLIIRHIPPNLNTFPRYYIGLIFFSWGVYLFIVFTRHIKNYAALKKLIKGKLKKLSS